MHYATEKAGLADAAISKFVRVYSKHGFGERRMLDSFTLTIIWKVSKIRQIMVHVLHCHYCSANLLSMDIYSSCASGQQAPMSKAVCLVLTLGNPCSMYSMPKPLSKQTNPNPNPIGSSNLYSNPINLLTSRHLGCFPLGGTKLQPLGIPPIHTLFIELLLLLSVSHGTLLAAALTRFNSLNQASIIRVELLVF